jgi:iron(III) transport system substrate-binding protein
MLKRIVFGLMAAAFLSAPAFAADEATMRAAKKEGKVTWYSSITLNIAQDICNRYNKKKTGVQCVLHRDGSGKLYRRYLQERKGGIYVADVIHTSNLGHFLNLKSKKIITPYKPAGTDNFNPKFVTKDNYWTILRAGLLMPFYNTNKISAKDAPKTYAGFLDPKWKGKIAHSHPSYSGFVTNGMISIVNKFGWGYYEKMAMQKPKIVQSAAGSIPLVARGELWLGAGTTSYSLLKKIQGGEPLKPIVPPAGLALVTSPNGVFTQAPNPNAARVFTDYLFSQETMQLLADYFLYVGNPDVKYPEVLPPLKDINLMAIDGDELKKKNKSTRKKFKQLFGV